MGQRRRDGVESKPAGTGPYVFKERQLSRYVLYERAPTPHWKHGTVDWKELQMTWTLEEPTRFAQLLAGETHLTEVNKDLTDELVNKGDKLIRSRGTAQQIQLNFGGLYFGTEDPATKRFVEFGGTTGKLDPKVPWTDKRVRQAVNKAIHREELLKVLYKGRAAPMYVHGFFPDLPGWDPTWEKRFPEMYGYDPKVAKRLLARPDTQGFQGQGLVVPVCRGARAHSLGRVGPVQLREVGIELELEEVDWVAKYGHAEGPESRGTSGPIHPRRRQWRRRLPPLTLARPLHKFESDEIYKMWEDLLQITDAAARNAQLRRLATTSLRSSRLSRSSMCSSR